MSEVSQPTALERQLIDDRSLINRRQMALRLATNYDFRTLILEGFCLSEAARYVQASSDPALSAESRQDALNLAQASGHLKRFLSVVVQAGAVAERNMPDLEAHLAEERSEGAVVEGELV